MKSFNKSYYFPIKQSNENQDTIFDICWTSLVADEPQITHEVIDNQRDKET